MTDHRQLSRWADARHHEAQQHHRDAQRELDAAAAELTTAGAALAERIQLLDSGTRAPDHDVYDRRAA